MLAIAGAKGGCGNTTTTLGLGGAFARRGLETLVVDCDRQQPDVHVVAGVDNEPTIAALGRDRSWRSLAQEIPGVPGQYVVPGPKMSESVSIETALEAVDAGSTQVLLDCPSGAGPDVVEPLSMADGVVVVTTGTERSLTDTKKTVDQARKQDVPIHGVVMTHCDSVPPEYDSYFDLPVLGVVPEYSTPLTNDAAKAVYTDVVDEILADVEGEPTQDAAGSDGPHSVSDEADSAANGPADVSVASSATAPSAGESGEWRDVGGFETGVDSLDEAVGGISPGSIVVLEADPASQSEQLLYQLTSTRGTLYLSTVRTEPVVRDALRAAPVDVGNPTVRTVSQGAVAEAEQLLSEVPDRSNVVVDSIGALERADRDEYVDFLNTLKEHLVETSSLAVFHSLSRQSVPDNRSTTKQLADAVLTFESRPDGHDWLSVPKLRSNGAYSAPLELRLGGRAETDSSPPE